MKRIRNDIFKQILSAVREGIFSQRLDILKVGQFNIYVGLGFHHYHVMDYAPAEDGEGFFGPIQRILFHRAYERALEDRALSEFRERMSQ